MKKKLTWCFCFSNIVPLFQRDRVICNLLDKKCYYISLGTRKLFHKRDDIPSSAAFLSLEATMAQPHGTETEVDVVVVVIGFVDPTTTTTM